MSCLALVLMLMLLLVLLLLLLLLMCCLRARLGQGRRACVRRSQGSVQWIRWDQGVFGTTGGLTYVLYPASSAILRSPCAPLPPPFPSQPQSAVYHMQGDARTGGDVGVSTAPEPVLMVVNYYYY